MNEITKNFLSEIVAEQVEVFPEIPHYGFTAQDFHDEYMKQKGTKIAMGTVYDRLNRLVMDGKLIKIKIRHNFVYYIPANMAKNAEIDEDLIIKSVK